MSLLSFLLRGFSVGSHRAAIHYQSKRPVQQSAVISFCDTDLTHKAPPERRQGGLICDSRVLRRRAERTTQRKAYAADQIPEPNVPAQALPSRSVPCLLTFNHGENGRSDEATASDHFWRPVDTIDKALGELVVDSR